MLNRLYAHCELLHYLSTSIASQYAKDSERGSGQNLDHKLPKQQSFYKFSYI